MPLTLALLLALLATCVALEHTLGATAGAVLRTGLGRASGVAWVWHDGAGTLTYTVEFAASADAMTITLGSVHAVNVTPGSRRATGSLFNASMAEVRQIQILFGEPHSNLTANLEEGDWLVGPATGHAYVYPEPILGEAMVRWHSTTQRLDFELSPALLLLAANAQPQLELSLGGRQRMILFGLNSTTHWGGSLTIDDEVLLSAPAQNLHLRLLDRGFEVLSSHLQRPHRICSLCADVADQTPVCATGGLLLPNDCARTCLGLLPGSGCLNASDLPEDTFSTTLPAEQPSTEWASPDSTTAAGTTRPHAVSTITGLTTEQVTTDRSTADQATSDPSTEAGTTRPADEETTFDASTEQTSIDPTTAGSTIRPDAEQAITEFSTGQTSELFTTEQATGLPSTADGTTRSESAVAEAATTVSETSITTTFFDEEFTDEPTTSPPPTFSNLVTSTTGPTEERTTEETTATPLDLTSSTVVTPTRASTYIERETADSTLSMLPSSVPPTSSTMTLTSASSSPLGELPVTLTLFYLDLVRNFLICRFSTPVSHRPIDFIRFVLQAPGQQSIALTGRHSPSHRHRRGARDLEVPLAPSTLASLKRNSHFSTTANAGSVQLLTQPGFLPDAPDQSSVITQDASRFVADTSGPEVLVATYDIARRELHLTFDDIMASVVAPQAIRLHNWPLPSPPHSLQLSGGVTTVSLNTVLIHLSISDAAALEANIRLFSNDDNAHVSYDSTLGHDLAGNTVVGRASAAALAVQLLTGEPSDPSSNKSSVLGAGPVVGIVVASVVALCLLLLLVLALRRSRRRRKAMDSDTSDLVYDDLPLQDNRSSFKHVSPVPKSRRASALSEVEVHPSFRDTDPPIFRKNTPPFSRSSRAQQPVADLPPTCQSRYSSLSFDNAECLIIFTEAGPQLIRTESDSD